MREHLARYMGQRITVKGAVLRLSARLDWHGVRVPTLMLGPVTLPDGAVLCDHLWLRQGVRIAALELRLGDVIRFSGRVSRYRRGYRREPGQPATWTEDCGLLNPTHCQVVARAVRPEDRPTAAPPAKPTQLLVTIAALWAELGEPPALPAVCARAGMKPWSAVHHLHRLAKAGSVSFQPNGSIYLPTIERSAHP